MLITVPLAILSTLAGLNIMTGGDWSGANLPFEGDQFTFVVDPMTGALGWIIIIILLVSLVGIRIMSSGLSESSVSFITIAVSYLGVWGILSGMSFSLITGIPQFGFTIYIVLTIVYVIGIFSKFSQK